MKKIKHAHFLRSVESDGVTTAEVEFAWEDDFGADVNADRYVAILKKQGEGKFDVEKIVKNDAEFAIDWYENADHEAYEDVTHQVQDRKGFVDQVLGYEGVCEDMECRRKS